MSFVCGQLSYEQLARLLNNNQNRSKGRTEGILTLII